MWKRLLSVSQQQASRRALTRFFASQAAKPFDKVLVANRGEIVQRVFKTCNDLDIDTVAVYSNVDAKAPFVKAADEAICLGPAAANESYLNVDAVLEAVRSSGAQAVHPGYGFLSENANFATAIQEQTDAVWLGPSPSAMRLMGDKLASKKVAVQAGVHIVPGHETPIESLEQALQLVHETNLTYPVLLKAAAGGGGKGMRTCYNDRDLKEAWVLSKAEALKFFSDDRLLLEKYIEEPHHIEFQTMSYTDSNGETQVLVFPERECSIQRRNQKVIEETPSVLLTPEVRQQMAEQVERLCKATNYESAGTVEFLVDKDLGFYFLEMNTRLQVEHPITEAITGVDLVKCMLWVAAGWGLPPEVEEARQGQLIMPFQGHAIETRVYAEDPLRGFLPSTGPLRPYVEPSLANNTEKAYIRIDSGVAPGHIVTPHYDPMLSKLVSFGPDRVSAINGLSSALDEYVIEGVQHNCKLVQSVLRHPTFVAGDTPTSFLPTHYPDGFSGVELSKQERHEYAAAAAAIVATRQNHFDKPALRDDDGTVYVRFGGLFGTGCKVEWLDATTAKVTSIDEPDAESETVTLDAPVVLDPTRYLATLSLNGKPRNIQVLKEQSTGELKLQMHGCDEEVLVLTKREHELSVHMHEPVAVDTSNVILSPMPGTLVSFAVSEGDSVEIGQEVCVVEAMKMQNIIRAPRRGEIGKLNVAVGASLVSDQMLVEFASPQD